MKSALFKLLVFAAFGLGGLAAAGPALAAHCFVDSKPLGAGEQGVFFNLATVGGPAVDVFDLRCNPGQGLECEEVAPGVFVASVPEGAHNAGPGDNECDGVGIDNIEACPGP